jgi:hypothetical protein
MTVRSNGRSLIGMAVAMANLAVAIPAAEPDQPAPVPPPVSSEATTRTRAGGILDAGSTTGRDETISWYAEVGLGYDSNVLLRTSNDPPALGDGGLADYGLVRGYWRIVDRGDDRLDLSGGARYSGYPETSRANLIGLASTLSGQLAGRWADPIASIGIGRDLYDDGDGLATRIGLNAGAVRLSDDQWQLERATVGVQSVRYDRNYPGSGMLYDAVYHHWWLLEQNNGRRRIEAALAVGYYHAHLDGDAYRFVRPSLGWYYRFGPMLADAGTWDASALAQIELRRSATPVGTGDPERQAIWSVGGGLDRWFNTWFIAGLFASFGHRQSTTTTHDYDRLQVGMRLGFAW